MKFETNKLNLASIVAVIPEHYSTFDEEIKNYTQTEDSSRKLKEVMGYNKHHIVKHKTTVSDMGIRAINELLNLNNLLPKDIGALILVTQTPDYHIPPTSTIIHGSIGLDQDCFCIDINDGCAGFLKAISIVSGIISPTLNNVIVLTGDVLSRKTSKRDRNSFPLVGDGVAASLFRYSEVDLFLYGQIYHDGSGAHAIMIPAGGMKEPIHEEQLKEFTDNDGNIRAATNLVMRGRDVFNFTQSIVAPFLKEMYSIARDFMVKRVYIHQANEFIIKKIRQKLELDKVTLPSDVILNYGNSSSATIPISIVEDHNCSSDTGEIILISGFGVGLTWGAAFLKIDNNFKQLLIKGDF